ncbi:MAG: hypothetical protein OXC48_09690 [Endozoicomonadaceae bacterium]|nr:hypothetical protein [Endozoicomonadaceae bacterium]
MSSTGRSFTSYPSDTVTGASKLPVKKIYNYYQKEPNVNGESYILVLLKQISISGHQRHTTTRHYYNNKDDYATYGLLKTSILTDKTEDNKQQDKLTREYHYIINTDKTTKTSYNVFEEGSSQERRSSAITVSLFTHQKLKITDASGKNIIHYHYDNQGRLIQADSAIGTGFAASKYYHYTESPQLNQVIVTNPNGLQQKVIFDGAGRKLESFSEKIDTNGKAEHNNWQLINSIIYDTNGQIAATHSYDYRKNSLNKPRQLTTTYDYTATGRILNKYLPDGEIIAKRYDDPDRCVVSYNLDNGGHSTISVVQGNILDKPVKQILLPESTDSPFPAKQYCTTGSQLPGAKVATATYDAYGRKISSTDYAGKTVITHYDDRGRISEIIDPAGDKIHNVYNFIGNIVEKWAEPVKDHHHYVLFSAQYNATGEPLWQAGEDGKRTVYTYTTDGKRNTITTPAGNIIAYKYNVLGLPVSKWLNGKLLVQMHYNPLTLQPDRVTDNTGTTTWTYSDDGKTEQLIHHAKNNQSADYKISWTYDVNRNVMAMISPAGQQIKKLYDHFGRISSVSYEAKNGKEQLLSTLTYGDFSRITTVKYGSGMDRHVEYNNYGQNKSVVDILSGKLLSSWQYSYDTANNMTTLIHKIGDHQQAVLHYHYDILDNLTTVICTGSIGLPLCPRDTHFKNSGLNKAPVITRQDYTFNALNRMTQVKEELTDTTQQKTLRKIVSYGYGDPQAPLRLQKISTQWNNQPSVINNFSYDTAGNMTTDGEGNHMTYNAFNQITQVVTPQGKQSQYIYDGGEREVKQIIDSDSIRYMFYTDKNLVGEQINDSEQNKHAITPLGVAKAIDGIIHEYYEQNYKQDITSILTKSDHGSSWVVNQRTVYSPYGMQWHNHTDISQPLYLRTLTGFDGEQHDPVTGWQFLGAGHRTYNPNGRYFVSEDPAGDGYAFGSNNPVMHTDPSGNRPKWLGSAMNIINYAGTLGMAALHKRWANAVGTALLLTIATVALGAGLVAGKVPSLIVAGVVGVSAATGSVMVTAAAVPPNKGLNIASAVAGGIDITLAIATLGFSMIPAVEVSSEELSETCSIAASVSSKMSASSYPMADDVFLASVNIAETSDLSGGNMGNITEVAINEAERTPAQKLKQVLGLNEGQDMMQINGVYSLAGNISNISKAYDLTTEIETKLFGFFSGAMEFKQPINVPLLADYLEAADKLKFESYEGLIRLVNNLYTELMGDIKSSGTNLADVERQGNGLILVCNVKIYFSRQYILNDWHVAISEELHVFTPSAVDSIQRLLGEFGIREEDIEHVIVFHNR